MTTFASRRLPSSVRAACRRCLRMLLPVLLWLLVGAPHSALGQDQLELMSGAKVRGRVLRIDKEAKTLEFELVVGTVRQTKTYSYDKIHAVTYQGQRRVLTPKDAAPTPGGPGAGAAGSSGGGETGGAAAGRPRSSAEIDRLIQQVGSTPPEWLESTPLDLPPTLDLSFPLKAPGGGWNPQKNVGQYIWDVINPNPGRWRSGVKLMYRLLEEHAGDPQRVERDMKSLATMYFELLQDYPRAAYWFRKAGAKADTPPGVMLAECYWRMGSKQLAMQMLRSPVLPMNAIKLYGDLGETAQAVAFAEAAVKGSPPGQAHEPLLLGADALRQAGEFGKAIAMYERVLQLPGAKNEEYQRRYQARARESIEAIRLDQRAQVSQVADGTYTAESIGYGGPVRVEVAVAGGKLTDVRVTSHQEKQFYASLTDVPAQLLRKQSVRGIDATSRATITSQAIVNATAKALAQGAR